MKRYDKITPEGTRDLLFEECAAQDQVVTALSGLFSRRGYRKVVTPTLEFYDVFAESSAHFPQENMYKLCDHAGRLMVLRPDCTIPIARLAATRLKDSPLPIRLYYAENVYRVEHHLRGRASEIFQCGVELIGASGILSDLEITQLAAESLEQIGGYRMELCHIGYFKALIDSLEADDGLKETIRQEIEEKNYAALRDVLEPFGDAPAAKALLYLPRLFGGEEVFDEAYALFDHPAARQSLDYLREIYQELRTLGLERQVLIDLSLVNEADYYTGIIFRGYFDGVGEPVLSGGRYDNLIAEFGEARPATGFGINVEPLARRMEHIRHTQPPILVFCPREQFAQAVRHIRRLGQQGAAAELSTADTQQEALCQAKEQGIQRVHVITPEGEIKEVELP